MPCSAHDPGEEWVGLERALRRDRLVRGVAIVPVVPGTRPGGSFDYEEAYITPRHPKPLGISAFTLRTAPAETQREVALDWFLANLRRAGPPSTDAWGQGKWGEARFSPKPVDPMKVLSQEFAGVLPGGIIRLLADLLGPDWLWIEPPPGPEGVPPDRAAALQAVDDLVEKIERFGPLSPLIGHNHPPADDDSTVTDKVPLTGAEHDRALGALRSIRSMISASTSASLDVLEPLWRVVAVACEKIGRWAFGKLDTFVEGVANEGGKAVGKKLPELILLGVACWNGATYTEQLVKAFFRSAGP